MTVQYASDLHLEFSENKKFLHANPLQPGAEVLLLAGDIVPFAAMHKHKDFFSYISDHFETTYWIPGNHEYYYSDVTEKSGSFKESIRQNVYLLNNAVVLHKQLRLIFSTLWSEINPDRQGYMEKNVSDFHAIKYKGYRFSIDRFNVLHEKCLRFISSVPPPEGAGKTIVVTHHVPTLLNYPPRYKDSDLTEAFAVELSGLIERMQPDYWIYGHHHTNVPDFKIGKTALLTNQMGYVQKGEHQWFDPGKKIITA